MLDERRAALEQLCRTQGVAIMYAFGSRSKELYHWLEQREPLSPSQSDIDIGVRAGDLMPLEQERMNLVLRVQS